MERITRVLGSLIAFGLVAALPDASHARNVRVAEAPTPFADATIIIEVNSTDQDAGFQIFLDGEGWKEIEVFDPRGRSVLEAEVDGGAKKIGGGTELFLETNEPEYEDLDELQELIELLPEGTYQFVGRTAEGNKKLTGEAELTHVVPAGPVILEPVPDPGEECAEEVDVDDAVIDWDPVTTTIFGSMEIEIVGYRVIVDHEDSGRSFEVELPADVTEVTVPSEFLEEESDYSFEILAIEASGNQTITESCFATD
jgi:hypothetical protein